MSVSPAKSFLLCLLIAAAVPLNAQGQQRYPIRPFAMVPIKGELFLRGEFQLEDEESTPSGFETRETDIFFEEGLDLYSHGYFYHPNLIEWDASVRLGLQQQWIDINNEDFDSDGNIVGYNLSAIFLKEKPITLQAFASQTQDFLDRDFARRLEVEREHQGLEILTKGRFPMSLLLENIKLREESDLREEEQHTRQLRFTISDQRSWDRQAKLIYEYENTDKTAIFHPSGGGPDVISDLPDRRHELDIAYLRRFGSGEKRHRYRGSLRAMDRRGFFENQVFTADQRLDLVHSDTLSSFYGLFYGLDKTDLEQDQTVSSEVGFSKSIYESLDIIGRLLFTDRRFEDGSEDIVGGFLDMDYRKKTPLGQYTSSLLLGKEYEKEESSGGLRSIRNESVTLTGLAFSQLSEPNVLGSLTVTNSAETTVYVQGTDYTVNTVGAFTEIARLAGGGIVDPENVLIDYTIQAAREAEFTTNHLNWTNRLKFLDLPLWLYFDYRLRDEILRSGDDPGNLDTLAVRVFGVETEYKGLKVTAEHEIRDQELSPPSDSTRLRASFHRRLGRNLNLSLGGEIQRLGYDRAVEFGLDPQRDFLDTNRAYGALTAKIRANTLIRFTGDYIRTQGRENDKLVRLGFQLEWKYRNLAFSLQARHDIFTQQSSEGSTDSVGFYLIRRF